jgi:hypothetical protein
VNVVVAAIRADDVNFPLFMHVLGAMLLVGVLLGSSVALMLSWRRADGGEATAFARYGLWTLALGGIPAYLVMRIGAQWTVSRERLSDASFTWLDIGYLTADLGGLVLLVGLVLAGVGLRRLPSDGSAPGALPRIVGAIAVVLLAAYVVTVWAMATKPD